MPRRIKCLAKGEVRADIQFLHADGCDAAEIQRRMGNVYGPMFMSDNKVRQWCRNFEADRADVHDASGQGRKRARDDLVQRVDQVIRENRRFAISVLSE